MVCEEMGIPTSGPGRCGGGDVVLEERMRHRGRDGDRRNSDALVAGRLEVSMYAYL